MSRVLLAARLVLVIGFSAMALAFPLMVPASYTSYTSVGFDVRRHDGPDWVNYLVRVQWPGDGTVRFGGERQRKPIFERPLEWWDPGVRFFQTPVRRAPRSNWNRAGFWWIEERFVRIGNAITVTRLVTEPNETIDGRWIGVPSWLPASVVLGVAIGVGVRWRRTTRQEM